MALLLAAAPAVCMVYMWVDSTGVAHYANKEYEIPARFKTKVKILYPEPSDIRSLLNTAQEQQKPLEMTVNVETATVPAAAVPSPPPVATTGSANSYNSKVRRRSTARRDSESSE
ncbi:MAG TPA: hypothetical protein HPP97_05700 [Desulfuromonadales bacterium]|nr:hypothetical protein [Desulfuromonadales bacterium]